METNSFLGIDMPKHSQLLSDCQGHFIDIQDGGLCCDKCGKELVATIKETIFDIKETISLMWGNNTKQGVYMDFRYSDPKIMEMWLSLSEKLGILNNKGYLVRK